MTLNEIATIRNILVGKQMQDLENELSAFKGEIKEEMETIRTSIDQLNQKIEATRREAFERIDHTNSSLRKQIDHVHHAALNQNQQQQRAIADAFSRVSETFRASLPTAEAEIVHD